MGRKPSADPKQNLSISLPLSTRAKIERFNPRNRSMFFNQAALDFMHRNDPEIIQQRIDEKADIDLENPRLEEAYTNTLLRTLKERIEDTAEAPHINPHLLQDLMTSLFDWSRDNFEVGQPIFTLTWSGFVEADEEDE